ncbi:hypothetical protein MTO96_052283 [Rhipicephalus appendiculatus]
MASHIRQLCFDSPGEASSTSWGDSVCSPECFRGKTTQISHQIPSKNVNTREVQRASAKQQASGRPCASRNKKDHSSAAQGDYGAKEHNRVCPTRPWKGCHFPYGVQVPTSEEILGRFKEKT